MQVLLDTHAILWWALDDPRLSYQARNLIASFQAEVLVSAASAWEISTKVRLGKLPEAEMFVDNFTPNVSRMGFQELAVTLEHGCRAGSLLGHHKDPFDRMLIAQALALNIPIISCDGVFDRYGVRRIW